MSYVSDNLRPGEQVLIEAKVNVIAFVSSIIVAIIVLIGFCIWLQGWGFLLGLVLGVVYVGIGYIKMKSIELAITNKKVVGKVGVIRTKSIDAYLNRIDNISISQDFWGKIFGYSTIEIYTTSAHLRFSGIVNAKDVKVYAMAQIEVYEAEKITYQAQLTAAEIAARMPR